MGFGVETAGALEAEALSSVDGRVTVGDRVEPTSCPLSSGAELPFPPFQP